MAYQHFPFQGPPYTKIGISGMIIYVPSGNPDIGFLFLWQTFCGGLASKEKQVFFFPFI
jgi:hypothetical protein